jgi:hypothetical protein
VNPIRYPELNRDGKAVTRRKILFAGIILNIKSIDRDLEKVQYYYLDSIREGSDLMIKLKGQIDLHLIGSKMIMS